MFDDRPFFFSARMMSSPCARRPVLGSKVSVSEARQPVLGGGGEPGRAGRDVKPSLGQEVVKSRSAIPTLFPLTCDIFVLNKKVLVAKEVLPQAVQRLIHNFYNLSVFCVLFFFDFFPHVPLYCSGSTASPRVIHLSLSLGNTGSLKNATLKENMPPQGGKSLSGNFVRMPPKWIPGACKK